MAFAKGIIKEDIYLDKNISDITCKASVVKHLINILNTMMHSEMEEIQFRHKQDLIYVINEKMTDLYNDISSLN